MGATSGILAELSGNLQDGEAEKVSILTRQALDEGLEPGEILDNALIAGMTMIGDKFKAHEIFLPDVLMAAKAMYAGMDILKPYLIKEGIPTIGKIVIGTVQGDLHDIGKNLVGIFLRGAGFEVIDLGNDVPPERFIDTAVMENAQVLGMSALLTTTMPMMKKVIDLARVRGVRDKFKIIVGGASLSREYARAIGADAYCFDGMNAVDCVKGYILSK
jgi:5-methyltetrahydrofolate--homocysteine methyltransferase